MTIKPPTLADAIVSTAVAHYGLPLQLRPDGTVGLDPLVTVGWLANRLAGTEARMPIPDPSLRVADEAVEPKRGVPRPLDEALVERVLEVARRTAKLRSSAIIHLLPTGKRSSTGVGTGAELLAAMVEAGKLERVGRGSGTYYRIPVASGAST